MPVPLKSISPCTGLTHCFQFFFNIFTSELCIFTWHRFDILLSIFLYLHLRTLHLHLAQVWHTAFSVFLSSPQNFASSPGTGLTYCFQCFFIFTSELCSFTWHRFDILHSMFFIFTSELCIFTWHRFDLLLSMFFLSSPQNFAFSPFISLTHCFKCPFFHIFTSVLCVVAKLLLMMCTGRCFSVHATKAYRGSSVVAPLILNLSPILRRLVNLTPRPL